MKTLTVFTPTYNRSHTLGRVYDSLCKQTCKDFEWLVIDDGSTDNTSELVNQWQRRENTFKITYVHKKNGGLYTGYNTAYEIIKTELNICIDSDDFMPENAVEIITKKWKEEGSNKYVGIIGLDFNLNGEPIGGYFPHKLHDLYFQDLRLKSIHKGDTKLVLRTDIMKAVAPQIGFEGEKNFNPIYMILQVCDKYPLLVLNENLCFVDYQLGKDSMSQAIFKQYLNSPRSFAKLRILEMKLTKNTRLNKFRAAIHYVSSCIISKDKNWLKNSPLKITTVLAVPIGLLLSCLIKYKAKH